MGDYSFYRKKTGSCQSKKREEVQLNSFFFTSQWPVFFLENYGFLSAKSPIPILARFWHFLIGNISRKINDFQGFEQKMEIHLKKKGVLRVKITCWIMTEKLTEEN